LSLDKLVHAIEFMLDPEVKHKPQMTREWSWKMHLLNADLQASCFEASFHMLGIYFPAWNMFLSNCWNWLAEWFAYWVDDFIIDAFLLYIVLLVNLVLLWEISLNNQHHP
jgi:hypothetical protein